MPASADGPKLRRVRPLHPDPARERVLLAKEEQRLERQLASLDDDWRRIPWIGDLAVAAIPVWIFAGFVWAALTVVFAIALAITTVYLIGVRREDYGREQKDIRRRMAELDAEQAGKA